MGPASRDHTQSNRGVGSGGIAGGRDGRYYFIYIDSLGDIPDIMRQDIRAESFQLHVRLAGRSHGGAVRKLRLMTHYVFAMGTISPCSLFSPFGDEKPPQPVLQRGHMLESEFLKRDPGRSKQTPEFSCVV